MDSVWSVDMAARLQRQAVCQQLLVCASRGMYDGAAHVSRVMLGLSRATCQMPNVRRVRLARIAPLWVHQAARFAHHVLLDAWGKRLDFLLQTCVLNVPLRLTRGRLTEPVCVWHVPYSVRRPAAPVMFPIVCATLVFTQSTTCVFRAKPAHTKVTVVTSLVLCVRREPLRRDAVRQLRVAIHVQVAPSVSLKEAHRWQTVHCVRKGSIVPPSEQLLNVLNAPLPQHQGEDLFLLPSVFARKATRLASTDHAAPVQLDITRLRQGTCDARLAHYVHPLLKPVAWG